MTTSGLVVVVIHIHWRRHHSTVFAYRPMRGVDVSPTQLHKDRIPRHWHPRDREDVGEDVGVVECGLYATVCVGETSCRRNVRTPPMLWMKYNV